MTIALPLNVLGVNDRKLFMSSYDALPEAIAEPSPLHSILTGKLVSGTIFPFSSTISIFM